MQVIKNTDHVLFRNDAGDEYHLSLGMYERLGEDAAIALAKEEIKQKNKLDAYNENEIDFEAARGLGFCEYGIEDFCNQLNLDVTKKYAIKDLREKLTLGAFVSYPSECTKLFGRSVLTERFGTITQILEQNQSRSVILHILEGKYIDETTLHLLSVDFASSVLHSFEEKYPEDNRPRKAIEAKLLYLDGKISKDELEAARYAARDAARYAANAARYVAYAASDAASAAASTAASHAARYATNTARDAASHAAKYKEFAQMIIKRIN